MGADAETTRQSILIVAAVLVGDSAPTVPESMTTEPLENGGALSAACLRREGNPLRPHAPMKGGQEWVILLRPVSLFAMLWGVQGRGNLRGRWVRSEQHWLVNFEYFGRFDPAA